MVYCGLAWKTRSYKVTRQGQQYCFRLDGLNFVGNTFHITFATCNLLYRYHSHRKQSTWLLPSFYSMLNFIFLSPSVECGIKHFLRGFEFRDGTRNIATTVRTPLDRDQLCNEYSFVFRSLFSHFFYKFNNFNCIHQIHWLYKGFIFCFNIYRRQPEGPSDFAEKFLQEEFCNDCRTLKPRIDSDLNTCPGKQNFGEQAESQICKSGKDDNIETRKTERHYNDTKAGWDTYFKLSWISEIIGNYRTSSAKDVWTSNLGENQWCTIQDWWSQDEGLSINITGMCDHRQCMIRLLRQLIYFCYVFNFEFIGFDWVD